MGLYKRCAHRGRQRDACAHGWWFKTAHQRRIVRVSLEVQFARACRGRGAKGIAAQLAAAVVAELKAGTFVERRATPDLPAPSTAVLTWPQFVEIYYRDYCILSGLRSAKDRRCRMLKFGRPWGDRPIRELAHRDVVAALGGIAAHATPATVRRHFSHVLHAFRWAADNGYLPASPIQRRSISLPAEDNERTRRLSHEEEQAIRDVGDELVNDLLSLALDTGLRFGALRLLTFEMFDPGVGKFGLLRLGRRLMKSKRPFDLPVTPRVREVLLRRRTGPDGEPHPPGAAVFGTVVGEVYRSSNPLRDRWKAALTAAGLDGTDLRFHDLRGEAASRLADLGVPVHIIMRFLDHGSLAMTQRYLRARVGALDDLADLERHLLHRSGTGSGTPHPSSGAPGDAPTNGASSATVRKIG